KRKGDTGSGKDSASGHSAPNSKASATNSTVSTQPQAEKSKVPDEWRVIFDEATRNGYRIPPPTVILKLAELRDDCITSFRAAQQKVQKAAQRKEAFEQTLSTGEIPSVVSSNVRIPPVQVGPNAFGVELEPALAEAKEIAEKDIRTAVASSTKYLSELYTSILTAVRLLVHVPTVAENFATRIKAYGDTVIRDGGGSDPTIWDELYVQLKAALVSELEMLNFDRVAIIARKAEGDESRAAAVSTARAKAEMSATTRPVEEIINEKLGAARESLKKEMAAMFQQQKKSGPDAPSSSRARSSAKPQQQTSASASTSKAGYKPKQKANEKETDGTKATGKK
ncbi:hypothetical protein R3P38DRAFT_2444228, partial [Favolaschia claudopus]